MKMTKRLRDTNQLVKSIVDDSVTNIDYNISDTSIKALDKLMTTIEEEKKN